MISAERFALIQEVVLGSKIWDGARRISHSFLLSPSVCRISAMQRRELSDLGVALKACLLGLSHIVVTAYDDRHLNKKGAWLFIRRVVSASVPKSHRQLQGVNPEDIPQLLKLDLMVNRDGEFRIAEIDGHNKHGVGYSTLAMQIRHALYPDAVALPGVVKLLGERFGSFTTLYADQERFYLPELQVMEQQFADNGIASPVVSEMDVRRESLEQGLFFDLPFLYRRSDLYETIIGAYLSGQVGFVIPPKPFMGAKGVLALLRNDTQDEELEAILRSHVDSGSLDLVRGYIPRTWIVGKKAVRIEDARETLASQRCVLKESVSSGMKGVYFSDENDFERVLLGACRQHIHWVLQAEVSNQPQTFSWFEADEGPSPSLQTSNDWFTRVIVHYVDGELADVVVTATQDRAVHGGERCLILGAAVE